MRENGRARKVTLLQGWSVGPRCFFPPLLRSSRKKKKEKRRRTEGNDLTDKEETGRYGNLSN